MDEDIFNLLNPDPNLNFDFSFEKYEIGQINYYMISYGILKLDMVIRGKSY